MNSGLPDSASSFQLAGGLALSSSWYLALETFSRQSAGGNHRLVLFTVSQSSLFGDARCLQSSCVFSDGF